MQPKHSKLLPNTLKLTFYWFAGIFLQSLQIPFFPTSFIFFIFRAFLFGKEMEVVLFCFVHLFFSNSSSSWILKRQSMVKESAKESPDNYIYISVEWAIFPYFAVTSIKWCFFSTNNRKQAKYSNSNNNNSEKTHSTFPFFSDN